MAVFNPPDDTVPGPHGVQGGACQVDDETILLVRVEDRCRHSHLTVARSKDGVSDWRIDSQRSVAPRPQVSNSHTLFS
jgi:predicted GH43/DUF377 family glycosyl hydrolase